MNLCASNRCDAKHRALLDEIRYSLLTLPSALDGSVDEHVVKILEIESFNDTNKLSLTKLKDLVAENNLIIDCYKLEDYLFYARNLGPHKVMYHFPLVTYNNLYYVLNFEPYAVMIGEPLAFDLMLVRKVVPADVKIRVHPAIGRPSNWDFISEKDNGIRHFWITPQTVSVYEPYVDTLELYDSDITREQALVDVYHQKRYLLSLGTLVKHCESDLMCNFIDNEFANRRLTCGQHCMIGSYNCHYCDRFEKTAELTKPSYSNE